MHRISRTLRLNHTKLKHYIERPSSDLPLAASGAFIELGFASPAPDRRCVVEMRHSDGSRMTVQDADTRELMKLARLFWSRP